MADEKPVVEQAADVKERQGELVTREGGEGLTRADFLKLAGATGLGIAGLGAFMGMGASPAQAAGKDGGKPNFLFVITAGSNDPNRAMLALLLADVVQKQEMGGVHIYLVLEGAELCKVGSPERITSSNFHRLGDAKGVLERLARNGARIGVCPPCAEWVGAVGDNLHDWAQREDGGALLRSMQNSVTSWL